MHFRAPRPCIIQALENEYAGALAEHETRPPEIERPRRPRRIVIGGGRRADAAEVGRGLEEEKTLAHACRCRLSTAPRREVVHGKQLEAEAQTQSAAAGRPR